MTQVHGLFFAVRPDAEASSKIVDARQRQTAAHGIRTGLVATENLHVTLHGLGMHDGAVPHDLLSRARDAGRRVEMAPFDVGFDRLGSMSPNMGGLVLTGSAELKTLRQLQRTLVAAMEAAGIDPLIRKEFHPHVSLLYGDRPVAREPIAPIRWRVDTLVLIDSFIGLSKHVEVGRWPLRSRQTSFSDW